ncbi:MAG: recombination protein O N-terminal domain-containing protein [Duncaniella sp.]|nr:recombination protein O N-terminal domain-containing protein [Duncaniella sp.]
MKLTFVCLRLTRHSDSRSVLTAFSRELGRVALSVPAGQGRGAARLRALTMPLSVVQCETTAAPGREVLPMRQAVPAAVFGSLHSHPVKQLTAMFVAELLTGVVRHGGRTRVCSIMCVAWPRCSMRHPTRHSPISSFVSSWGLLGLSASSRTPRHGGPDISSTCARGSGVRRPRYTPSLSTRRRAMRPTVSRA